MNELLERLRDAKTMIDAALADLEGDPALAYNLHWRENLAETGYRVETLLSEEDEEDEDDK